VVNERIKLLGFLFLLTLGFFIFSVNVLAQDRYACTDDSIDGSYDRCSSNDNSGSFDWGSISCVDCGDAGCSNGDCNTCETEWFCQGDNVIHRSSSCAESVWDRCSNGCDAATNTCRPSCDDPDGDKYGPNCPLGDFDCDPGNPLLQNNCNRCDNGVSEAGEVCQPGETRTSFCDSNYANCGGSRTDTCRSDCSGWTVGSCSGGSSCTSAPATQCVGHNLVSYRGGSCSGGSCNYLSSSNFCSWGCSGASCNAPPSVIDEPDPEPEPVDLCKGVSCASPPGNVCKPDGSGYVVYSDIGTCRQGQCSYAPSTIPCDYGCSNGRCDLAPPVVVSCGGFGEKCCSGSSCEVGSGLDCLPPSAGYSSTPILGESICQIPPPKCEDFDTDKDGYGEYCDLGLDCDEGDKRLTNNCNQCGNKVYEPGNNEKCDWGKGAVWIDSSQSCGDYPTLIGKQSCSDSCRFVFEADSGQCQSCGDGICQEGIEDYTTCIDDCAPPPPCGSDSWEITSDFPSTCPESGERTRTVELKSDLDCLNPEFSKPALKEECTPPVKEVKKPDLTIKDIVKVTPKDVIAGEEVKILFEIENIGNGDSVEHRRNVIDYGDGSKVAKSLSTLKTIIVPGGTSRFSGRYTYEEAGTYTIRAEVYDNEDSEDNNNIQETTITILAPDACTGVICRTPPERSCSVDGNDIVVSSRIGQCSEGECIYGTKLIPCSLGCEEGNEIIGEATCRRTPVDSCGSQGQSCCRASKGDSCNPGLVCSDKKVGYSDTVIGNECEAPRPCEDLDGDLHGQNCALGPDCDDNEPLLQDNCNECGNRVVEPGAGEKCEIGQEKEGTCYADVNFCNGDRTDTCRSDCKAWVAGSCSGGKSCETPPTDRCDNNNENVLVRYSGGICGGGQCEFNEDRINCDYGCDKEKSECKPEPLVDDGGDEKGAPDLEIVDIEYSPGSPKAGETVTFSVNVKNIGDVASKDFFPWPNNNMYW